MSRRTVVDAIIDLMEDPVGMENDFGSGEVAMTIMPSNSMGGIEDRSEDEDESESHFSPEDYQLARELVDQVGCVDRARELLDKLDDVMDTLDLEPAISSHSEIAGIADQMPDDPDLPNNRHNMFGVASFFDAGHVDHI